VHDGPQDGRGEQEGGGEAPELARLEAAANGDRDGHRQRGGGDRAEVDRAQALQRQQEPDRERAAQRAPLPEAVQGEEREGQEHGDLRVQVRQAVQRCGPAAKYAPATKAASRSPLTRRTRSCAPRPEKSRLRGGRRCTRGRDRPAPAGGRRGRRAGAGSRRRRARPAAGGRRGPGRRAPGPSQRLARPGEDPGVEAAVGAVHRPRVRETPDERPAHDREQEGVAGDRDRHLRRGHGPGNGGDAARPRAPPTPGSRRDRPRPGRERRSVPTPTRGAVAQEPRRDRLAAAVRRVQPSRRRGPARRGRGARGARPALRRGRSPSMRAAGPLGLEHRVAVERDRGAASALHPQLVATEAGTRSSPAQRRPTRRAVGRERRSRPITSTAPGPSVRSHPRARHLGREAAGRAAPRPAEGGGRTTEPERDTAPRAGAPLPPRQGGEEAKPRAGPPGAAHARRAAAAPRWAPTATRRARGARSRGRSRAGRPGREHAPGPAFYDR